MEKLASPCVSLCRLNDQGICQGCYRSIEEIRSWSHLDDEERQQVIVTCSERAEKTNI